MLSAFLAFPVACGLHALELGAPFPLAAFLLATVAALQLVAPLALVALPLAWALERRA